MKKGRQKNSSIGQLHPGKQSLERPNSIRSKLLIRWRGIGRRWTITYENVPGIESVAASARKSASVNLEKKTFLESGYSHEKPQSSSKDQKERAVGVNSRLKEREEKREGERKKERKDERKTSN